ncbi:MAG: hypothetical protein QNJ97_27395 [Myxococcota bacterium]|nr:hypothetical protein [Myxococcota bacterium]
MDETLFRRVLYGARCHDEAAVALYEKGGDDFGRANALKLLGDLERLVRLIPFCRRH